jgi:hypothetical protein
MPYPGLLSCWLRQNETGYLTFRSRISVYCSSKGRAIIEHFVTRNLIKPRQESVSGECGNAACRTRTTPFFNKGCPNNCKEYFWIMLYVSAMTLYFNGLKVPFQASKGSGITWKQVVWWWNKVGRVKFGVHLNCNLIRRKLSFVLMREVQLLYLFSMSLLMWVPVTRLKCLL